MSTNPENVNYNASLQPNQFNSEREGMHFGSTDNSAAKQPHPQEEKKPLCLGIDKDSTVESSQIAFGSSVESEKASSYDNQPNETEYSLPWQDSGAAAFGKTKEPNRPKSITKLDTAKSPSVSPVKMTSLYDLSPLAQQHIPPEAADDNSQPSMSEEVNELTASEQSEDLSEANQGALEWSFLPDSESPTSAVPFSFSQLSVVKLNETPKALLLATKYSLCIGLHYTKTHGQHLCLGMECPECAAGIELKKRHLMLVVHIDELCVSILSIPDTKKPTSLLPQVKYALDHPNSARNILLISRQGYDYIVEARSMNRISEEVQACINNLEKLLKKPKAILHAFPKYTANQLLDDPTLSQKLINRGYNPADFCSNPWTE